MHTSINWKPTQHFIFWFILILKLSIENSTVCRMECTENLSSYFPSSPSDQFHERFAVHRVSASISIGDFELCLSQSWVSSSSWWWLVQCSGGQLSACTLHPPATISRLPPRFSAYSANSKRLLTRGQTFALRLSQEKTPENCLVAVFSSVKRNTT